MVDFIYRNIFFYNLNALHSSMVLLQLASGLTRGFRAKVSKKTLESVLVVLVNLAVYFYCVPPVRLVVIFNPFAPYNSVANGYGIPSPPLTPFVIGF